VGTFFFDVVGFGSWQDSTKYPFARLGLDLYGLWEFKLLIRGVRRLNNSKSEIYCVFAIGQPTKNVVSLRNRLEE
jgi:hypothetical protein